MNSYFKTLLNFPRKIVRKAGKRSFRKRFNEFSLKKRFSEIYSINYWGNLESASGKGSTLEHTSNLRKYLPLIFEQLKIKSVFDGPCGDFNWMQHVVRNRNVKYIGGDIVGSLVEKNNRNHRSDNIKFLEIDLTSEQFPTVDFMVCRDCLFHLSFEDTKKLLNNFLKSDIKYLLTTTYENNDLFVNSDIISGHFRLIDLFSAPYNFPANVVSKVDDWKYPDHKRYMCLWTRDQLEKPIAQFIKSDLDISS